VILLTSFGAERGYRRAMDILRRLTGSAPTTESDHVPAKTTARQADRCQECGSSFNLRLCATCGHIGCCESQAGHALSADHPVIYQVPADSGFIWCYVDRTYVG
jgi:uncharacterized UBP type Zn finger protein